LKTTHPWTTFCLNYFSKFCHRMPGSWYEANNIISPVRFWWSLVPWMNPVLLGSFMDKQLNTKTLVLLSYPKRKDHKNIYVYKMN
jgi:hypothetical protein